MVNMMMETRPATAVTAATAVVATAAATAATAAATNASQAGLADSFRDELGDDAELAQHRQQLGKEHSCSTLSASWLCFALLRLDKTEESSKPGKHIESIGHRRGVSPELCFATHC